MFLAKRHSPTQKEGDHRSKVQTRPLSCCIKKTLARVLFGEFTISLHNKLEEQNENFKLTFYWVNLFLSMLIRSFLINRHFGLCVYFNFFRIVDSSNPWYFSYWKSMSFQRLSISTDGLSIFITRLDLVNCYFYSRNTYHFTQLLSETNTLLSGTKFFLIDWHQ